MDSIGKLLTGTETRDAIHVAIAPVRCDGNLRRGDRVRFSRAGSTEWVGTAGEADIVGIIDPFLPEPYLDRGDRCWLFLFPNTVTSLRHEWTHPAFDAPTRTPEKLEDAEKIVARAAIAEIAAELHLPPSVLMSAARRFLATGDYMHQDGSSHWRDEFHGYAKEFWQHYETLTGVAFKEPGAWAGKSPFSCSC